MPINFIIEIMQVVNETVGLANIVPAVFRRAVNDVKMKGKYVLQVYKNNSFSCGTRKSFWREHCKKIKINFQRILVI